MELRSSLAKPTQKAQYMIFKKNSRKYVKPVSMDTINASAHEHVIKLLFLEIFLEING